VNTPLDRLTGAFEPFRSGLQADGADLRVLEVDGSQAIAELVVSEKTCLECIMPKEHLEQVLLVIGREASPELTSVVLRDQRESPAGAEEGA
jgi:hypothetical protein